MDLGYQKLPDIPSQNNGKNYHTADEISFINHMKLYRPAIAFNYCKLITSGMRRYDKSVDVARVWKFAHSVLAELPGVVTCQ